MTSPSSVASTIYNVSTTTASMVTLVPNAWNSPYHPITQGIVWLMVAFLSMATIIGNAMVVIAYKIERNISKQVSNRYIVSLAVSDLIIGIEGFPLFTVYVLNGERWPLGAVTCETWLFLDYTLCLVSILTVLLITADRYLSVCHTAKYLKWQSPTKTQMTIIFSWVIPAIIFGVMIYGWSAMTGSADRALRPSRRNIHSQQFMRGAECSAPFLTNPFVNMGMYVAYYWTTLVAMLILYKGIHQAAKNLEKKAKAKERRHIALILSQRLGTQVGVSLMLQSRKEKEEAEERRLAEEARTDSGYHTAPAASTINAESDLNLAVIQEERSMTINESKSSFEMDKISIKTPTPLPESVTTRSPSQGSLNTASIVRIERDPNTTAKLDRTDSLSLLFNDDDDLSSVLHFKTPLHQVDSTAESTCSSMIGRGSTRYRMSKRSARSTRSSSAKNGGASAKIARKYQQERTQMTEEERRTPWRVEIDDLVEETISVPINNQLAPRSLSRGDRWVASMRARIQRALIRRRSTYRERSPSLSSSSSSGEGDEQISVPKENPRNNSRRESGARTPTAPVNLVPPQRTETLLSPGGVSRKISSFGSYTRERMISTIFAPIISRSRKPTKAEKRAHKAFRTITFIVGFFAILWSPYYIMATIYGFCKGECIPTLLYTLSYYMCYLNSTGNPFAYALANRQFRSTFLRMLRGNFNSQV